MIFNNLKDDDKKVITEAMVMESLMEGEEFTHGFMFRSYFIEDKIMLEQIKSEDLHLPVKAGESRNILIGYGTNHGPRIKISRYKNSVTEDKTKNISMYVSNEKKHTIEMEGDPKKNINMKGAELREYEDFVWKHWNIIRLAKSDDILDDCEAALLQDADLDFNKIPYERDRDGNLTIYNDDGSIKSKTNLKGGKI